MAISSASYFFWSRHTFHEPPPPSRGKVELCFSWPQHPLQLQTEPLTASFQQQLRFEGCMSDSPTWAAELCSCFRVTVSPIHQEYCMFKLVNMFLDPKPALNLHPWPVWEVFIMQFFSVLTLLPDPLSKWQLRNSLLFLYPFFFFFFFVIIVIIE